MWFDRIKYLVSMTDIWNEYIYFNEYTILLIHLPLFAR